MTDAHQTIRPQGFAALPPAVRSEISRKGGRAAHARGTAHKFTSAEGKAASRKAAMGRKIVAVDVLPLNESLDDRIWDDAVKLAEAGDEDARILLANAAARAA